MENGYIEIAKAITIKRVPRMLTPEAKKAIKERQRAYYKAWYAKNGRKRNTIQMRAHSIVAQAIKNGTLIRPEECSNCTAVAGHGMIGHANI